MHSLPRIWLSPPHMCGREQDFIREAFESNWIAPLGPQVNGFENDLKSFTGIRHAAALSSGTAAIHLALIMLGVKAGDLVICQSFTFSGTANPIAYLGATPVFVDSEKDTWNMDPQLLEEAIQACQEGRFRDLGCEPKRAPVPQKPKAIIVVDLYGMPARMDEIASIAQRYEIPLIEDAAEALGSRFQGKACGTFGLMGIFSFNGNKIINTSGGGALLSNQEELVLRARFLATQARDHTPHYQHSEIGYNYRMSNVVAAIGRGQMTVANERVQARRSNFQRYLNYFTGLNRHGKYQVHLLCEPDGFFSNRWLTTITLEPDHNNGITREQIRLHLESENIESRPLWKPMHQQPVFADAPRAVSGNSEHLFEIGLCLPSGSSLNDQDFERIFRALDQVFSR